MLAAESGDGVDCVFSLQQAHVRMIIVDDVTETIRTVVAVSLYFIVHLWQQTRVCSSVHRHLNIRAHVKNNSGTYNIL